MPWLSSPSSRVGSVLNGGEGGVRLQEVGDDLSTLGPKPILAEPANKSRGGASMAADSGQIGQVCGRRAGGGIPERLEGRVLLEALR